MPSGYTVNLIQSELDITHFSYSFILVFAFSQDDNTGAFFFLQNDLPYALYLNNLYFLNGVGIYKHLIAYFNKHDISKIILDSTTLMPEPA